MWFGVGSIGIANGCASKIGFFFHCPKVFLCNPPFIGIHIKQKQNLEKAADNTIGFNSRNGLSPKINP